MRRRFASLPLLALLLAPGLARADVLEAIDARWRAGAIDEGTRHYYRVAALRDPAALPPELRALPRDPAAGARLTAVAFEAYQWAARHPRDPRGVVLRDILLPVTDLAHVLDSAILPIRVSWADPAYEALGRTILDAAEVSWQVMTEEYGFPAPPIEPGTDRYRILVTSTGGWGSAYTAPYAENPATPWSDCFSYVVVDPSNSQSSAPATVAHELNHAMQSALDCAEIATFMENTSTYIMSQVFPEAAAETIAYMPYFQSEPWRALDYMNPYGSDLYEYGGTLFAIALAESWGGASGPIFLRRIWEDCRQDDDANSRTYYDAVASLVGAAGGPATIEDVLMTFSEARFFVGQWDDGAHLPTAAAYPAVARAAAYAAQDLPVRGAHPSSAAQPAPFGVNHITLDLAGAHYPLRLAFDGADAQRWRVRAILTGAAGTTAHDLVLDEATQAGALDLDPAGQRLLVLVVANLGAPGYSPNERLWPTAAYTYSIDQVIPPPTVAGSEPATVARGTSGAIVRLVGSGFAGGTDFAVAFDRPGVRAVSVLGVLPEAATITVDVAPDAALGPTVATVTNSGGAAASGPGFTVVEAAAPDGGTGGGSAGGCQAGGSATPGAAMLLALLVVAFARRRR
ncbi:MAG TPA: DUF6055 domain-containing protein [Polyangia bacterium]|jgi:uncharacterized protein (TIGR03382 family)